VPLDQVKLAPPILYPGAYFCAAANYYQHSKEMNPARNVTREGKQPYFFLKPSLHTTIGPDESIRIPKVTQKLDWEIELAVVIGRAAANLTVENALSCVAGYTIVNDLSCRDLSKRDDWQFVSDWFGQKVFDTAMPMGPWITPAEEIADPMNLDLKLWLNGELQQNANTSGMIFNIAEQIEYVSRRLTLRPGDIVATGTPAGVGAPRGLFLKSGDVIRAEIQGIGSMQNPVA
jgi:2-keto-4-pentenoate hydratase/2-oxohepta-3-ene-1,7-dioic acid hydratase in catechol pathway